MANVIINSKLYDEAFVRDFTFGFEDFEDEQGQLHQGFKSLVLAEYTLERVSLITGITSDIIARLAGEFATNRPAVAIMPAELGELNSGNSLYTALAIHAMNALVGSIDTSGGVLVQRFPDVADWPDYAQDTLGKLSLAQERLDKAGTAELPLATSAYQQVARHILEGQPYPLNLLLMLNANPVYDVPNQGQFVKALMKTPFVVSFSSILDESASHADLVLPASTFLETWGMIPSKAWDTRESLLRQPAVAPVMDSRDPADVLLDLANRLGGPLSKALPWKDYQSLVKQRLSKVDMDWEKFESNGFWAQLVYFNAQPGSPAWSEVVGANRLNAPKDGRFDFFSRELYSILTQLRGIAPADLDCLPHFTLPAPLAEDFCGRQRISLLAGHPGYSHPINQLAGDRANLARGLWFASPHQVGKLGRDQPDCCRGVGTRRPRTGMGRIALRARAGLGAHLRWTMAQRGIHASWPGTFHGD